MRENVRTPMGTPSEAEDDTEMRIARLFAELFGMEEVGPEDNFFELGGDSLLAESLMTSIEQEFGAVMPVSALLEAYTPRALAHRLDDRKETGNAGNLLITIRQEGVGPAIFCVHGMNGEPTFGRTLAAVLDAPRPVYALRAPGLEPGELPAMTVQKAAADYLAAIRAAVPNGPYIFLGQCGASMIAIEMALQVLADGQEMLGLIIVDPSFVDLPWLQKTGLALKMKQAETGERMRQIFDFYFKKESPSGADRREAVKALQYALVGAYPPRPYPGRTLLLYLPLQRRFMIDKERGFVKLLVGETDVVEVLSQSHMRLFKEDVDKTASAINAFLAKIAPVPEAQKQAGTP